MGALAPTACTTAHDSPRFAHGEAAALAPPGFRVFCRAQASGDCEDYALEKQRRLTAKGFARSNLRLAVAVQAELGVHVVLIVRSNRGDLVLDNLTDAVRPWNKTGYVFLTRQSMSSDLEWRRIASALSY